MEKKTTADMLPLKLYTGNCTDPQIAYGIYKFFEQQYQYAELAYSCRASELDSAKRKKTIVPDPDDMGFGGTGIKIPSQAEINQLECNVLEAKQNLDNVKAVRDYFTRYVFNSIKHEVKEDC